MTLFGPFTELLTMRNLPERGPIADDQLEVLSDAGILVQNGVITALGRFEDLRESAKKIHKTESPSVAIPGLIDAHTHLCFAGSRARDYSLRVSGKSYLEIAKSGGGILETVGNTRNASEQDLIEGIVERCKQLLKRGVTTCEVKSGYGLTVKDELKMLDAIRHAKTAVQLIPTCLAAHLRPPEFNENRSYLDHLITELLPKAKDLCNRIDIFIEESAFTVDEARDYLSKAKEMGFAITIHADQFTEGGVELAIEVGAISADHLEASGEDVVEKLANSNVIPVVLPGASLGLGMQYAPARKLLDHGLPLAIASDWNPGSAPMGHLLLQAALMGAAEKLSLAETIAGITERAARALGLLDRGVLDVGKRADFVVYPCAQYQEILYNQGMLSPSSTIIEGKCFSLRTTDMTQQPSALL